MSTNRTGAIGSILDEYELAIAQLQKVIRFITETQLATVADPHTTNPHCKSVQTILGHVVRAGYSYATQIANHKGAGLAIPGVVLRDCIPEYLEDLNDMFAFTEGVFKNVSEDEVLQHDNSRKILVTWGQSYDIEQLMEHAIVHILRHRRQIERIQRNDFKYVG